MWCVINVASPSLVGSGSVLSEARGIFSNRNSASLVSATIRIVTLALHTLGAVQSRLGCPTGVLPMWTIPTVFSYRLAPAWQKCFAWLSRQKSLEGRLLELTYMRSGLAQWFRPTYHNICTTVIPPNNAALFTADSSAVTAGPTTERAFPRYAPFASNAHSQLLQLIHFEKVLSSSTILFNVRQDACLKNLHTTTFQFSLATYYTSPLRRPRQRAKPE